MANRQYGKYPGAFSLEIMKRFMDDKRLSDFNDEYKNACYKRARTREITPEDRKILKDYKGGMTFSELCEKYKKVRATIIYCIAIASRE